MSRLWATAGTGIVSSIYAPFATVTGRRRRRLRSQRHQRSLDSLYERNHERNGTSYDEKSTGTRPEQGPARGAFHFVPWGYVRLPDGTVAFDPDEQVRAAVHRVFDTFQRLGSALATLRELRRDDVKLPMRNGNDQLAWRLATVRSCERHYTIRFTRAYYSWGRPQTQAVDATVESLEMWPTSARTPNGPCSCPTTSRPISLGTSFWPTSDNCCKTGPGRNQSMLAHRFGAAAWSPVLPPLCGKMYVQL